MRRLITVLRSIGSIVAGYACLAISNMLFVILWFVNPVAEIGMIWILVLSVPYTLLSSVGSGFVSAWIAERRYTRHAMVVAALMGLVIITSIVMDVAAEPNIYKWLYLFIMIPATVWGGVLFERKKDGIEKETA